MTEDLKPFLDEAFSKRPVVFYDEEFVSEIVQLPVPEILSEYREDVISRRKDEVREYLLEKCDYFADYGLCAKHTYEDKLSSINLAFIHPKNTLYFLDSCDTFLNLREYNRENRSISINTSSVSHIKSEVGKGSKVSTIYLTDDKIA